MSGSAIGASPYCAPCENMTHWIEIVVRDEFNQPFENVSGILKDACDNEFPVVLGEAPILLTNLASGPVTLLFDSNEWLKESQSDTHKPNKDGEPTLDYSKSYKDHIGGAPEYFNVTAGDLTTLTDDQELPLRHQKGQADNLKLISDNSYVLNVRGFNFITLRVGMFFDGTANNTYSAQWGKQQLDSYYQTWNQKYQVDCEIISKKTGIPKDQIPVTELSDECFEFPKEDNFLIKLIKNDDGEIETVEGSAANEITNVQKLFSRYVVSDNDEGELLTYAEYISGIGTGNTTDIAPAEESLWGQGTGTGKYGVTDKVDTAIEQLLSRMRNIGSTMSMYADGFRKLQFDVFGFSRGAAAARHFINVVLSGKEGQFAVSFVEACKQNKIALTEDFDWEENSCCEITFAGLFDTVASIVSLVSLDSKTILDFDVSTHHNNGDVKLWLDPSRVRQAVHLTADPTIECRYNFSLNHINSAPNFLELVLPGSHSDLGGGYHSSLSFSQENKDYLLPLLEKKLIKRVSRSYMSSQDRNKAFDDINRELNEAMSLDQKTGWGLNNYVMPPILVRKTGNDSELAIGTLYLKRRVEGDMSRLYLRMMYGLAEFHGVPLDDDEGYLWRDEHLFKVDDYVGLASFKALNEEVLKRAKLGEYEAILNTLSNVELREQLFKANLFHHSSDDSFAFRPLYNEEEGCYKRASYMCEKEN
ncbi:T6SS phospholipase effector Tle1-like catalytic domain-containing protein [Vibrio paucivorans]